MCSHLLDIGERYEIPIFCINDPVQYDVPKKLMHKKENVPDDQITVSLKAKSA